jgi:hypothetical protein
MTRSTQIWVGVVVLAALAGGVYKVAKDDQTKGFATTTSAEMPEIKAPDDVDKISITNADKPEVVLEKRGEATWVVVKPVEAPANQTNVKSLVDNMKELKAKEVIVAEPGDDVRKDYQFEPAKGVHVVAWKGGEKKLDVTFGKSGARGQMAMIDGKPSIYAVSGYSSYLYTRETKGWRETDIFKFDDANATSMTIEGKGGTFSFTKGETWAGTYKGQPIPKLDEDKVKEALRAFKNLNAEDFGDGKTPADTGLDTPESKVTINLKDGAGTYILKVGSTATGSSRYAMKDGSDTIYVIPQFSADWATADLKKFQKEADAGAKDAPAAMPAGMPHGMGGMPGMPPGMGGMPPGMDHGDDDGHGH